MRRREGEKSGDFTSEVLAQPEPAQPRPFIISRLDSGRRSPSAARRDPGVKESVLEME